MSVTTAAIPQLPEVVFSPHPQCAIGVYQAGVARASGHGGRTVCRTCIVSQRRDGSPKLNATASARDKMHFFIIDSSFVCIFWKIISSSGRESKRKACASVCHTIKPQLGMLLLCDS